MFLLLTKPLLPVSDSARCFFFLFFLHIQSSQHGSLTYTRHNTCPSPQTAPLLLYLRLDACFNSPPPQTSQVRKKNVLKDFVHMAAPFGVTHLVVFNKTDVGTNMRIARMPRGPTLTFRVNSFALMRDVVNSQSKPKSFGSQFDRSVGVVGITSSSSSFLLLLPPPPPFMVRLLCTDTAMPLLALEDAAPFSIRLHNHPIFIFYPPPLRHDRTKMCYIMQGFL